MYVFKRTPKVREKIQIGDDVVEINLDAETIAYEFTKRVNAVIEAENKMRALAIKRGKVYDATIQEYGAALMLLFACVFGADVANKIVEYYENRFIEMSLEVLPFITDVVAPAVRESMAIMQKRAAENYKNAKRARAK